MARAVPPVIDPRRILVASQMGIGNLILFLPFLEALRKGFPDAHIAAVFSEKNGADDLLRELTPHLVDEIVQLDLAKRSKPRRMLAGLTLGLRGWDLAVFRFAGYRAETILAAYAGRARWRLGHVTSPDWRNRCDSVVNIPVVMREGDREVDRYLQLAETLGLELPVRLPRLRPPADAVARLSAKFPELSPDSGPSVALAPGSSAAQAWKRWPHERWVELVRLLGADGIRPVLFGSRSESEMTASIIADAGASSFAVDTAGKLRLAEAAVALQAVPTLVCCDSALMHLSAAVGTPVVGIFGPTDEGRTGPTGPGHTLLRSAGCRGGCYSLRNPQGHLGCDVARCMRELLPEAVMAAVRRHLGSRAL